MNSGKSSKPSRALRFAAAVIMLAAAFSSASAHADSITDYVHFEAGIGISKFNNSGDGIWFQADAPHTLRMTSPAVEAGFTGDLYGNGPWALSWHADYAYLGTVHTDAMATTDDDYNFADHKCIQCIGHSRFVGGGNVNGVLLTLEPSYTWRGIRFAVEGGAFVFRPTWRETVYIDIDGKPPGLQYVHHDPILQVGPVVGASISYKNLSLVYQRFWDKSRNDAFPPIWSATNLLLVRYKF